jgi:hypothetical protein
MVADLRYLFILVREYCVATRILNLRSRRIARQITLSVMVLLFILTILSSRAKCFSIRPVLTCPAMEFIPHATDLSQALRCPRSSHRVVAGPYFLEAFEFIASIMAALMETEEDRHCLRVAYPSESILVEACAQLTADTDGPKSLMTLHQFIQTGVVADWLG